MASRAGDDERLRTTRRARLALPAALVLLGAATLATSSLSSGCSSAQNDLACANPSEGCACDEPGVVVDCSESVDYIPGADSVECRSGKRTCANGTWGACVGAKHSFQSVPPAILKSTTATPCTANPCDPTCQIFVDTSSDLDGGSAFTTNEAGGISLTPQEAGTVGNWEGGAATCSGLQCQIASCLSSGGYTATKLTGAVYDPAGKNPIPNVMVYIPNGTPTVPSDGVSCNSCQAASGNPIVSAVTDYQGRFTLTGVPSGSNIPLVIQSGKWFRQITLPSVTPCVTNTQPTTTNPSTMPLIRMPKNRSEGHIPRIAFMSGSADPFECVLLKMGMDANSTGEFSKPTDSSGNLMPQRIHWYNSNKSMGEDLSSTAGGPGVSVTNLLDAPTRLANYDAVILSCEGSEYQSRGTEYANLVDYANAGGRIFATHFSYVWLQYANATSQWPFTPTYWNHASFPASPLTTYIDRSFPKGDNFAKWLNYVGASPTLGQLSIIEGRHDYDFVDQSRATRWMTAWSNNAAVGTLTAPPNTGAQCSSTPECGAGLNCVGSGYCTDNSACSATTACTPKSVVGCYQDSDCKGANTYCVDDKVCETAVKVSKSTYYYLNRCGGGFCPDGTACTSDTQCAASKTKACNSNSDCPSTSQRCLSVYNYDRNYSGVCETAYNGAWTPGVCDGPSCVQKTCTTNADCSGAVCSGGKCVEDHDMEPLMTFNVPVGAAPTSQCGRVVFSDFHVSANALSGYSGFPASCNTGNLSAQEKALEYMLFDLTSCLSPDYIPPGGSGPAYTVPMAITRDYVASCPIGYAPVWHFFDFATTTPGDSRIEFWAQTGSSTTSLLPASPGVLLASVSGATVPPYSSVDVATKLATTSPPTTSGTTLHLTFALYPTSDGTQSPTLDGWRQSYDCVANE